MANYFKQRNFDGHLESGYKVANEINFDKKYLSHSDALYDRNAGLTHAFIHTNKGKPDDEVRLIGDVEICMSQSPEITSLFSPEYQRRLRMGLVDNRGAGPTGLTDDQLMESVPCNVEFERDEIAAFSKATIDTLEREAKKAKKDIPKENPSTPPAPDEPPISPAPTNS